MQPHPSEGQLKTGEHGDQWRVPPGCDPQHRSEEAVSARLLTVGASAFHRAGLAETGSVCSPTPVWGLNMMNSTELGPSPCFQMNLDLVAYMQHLPLL